MELNDLPQVKNLIQQLEGRVQVLRKEVREVEQVFSQLREICDDEEQFLYVLRREGRTLVELRRTIDTLPVAQQLKRRLPHYEAKLAREIRDSRRKADQADEQAEEVHRDLQEILRKFLEQ